VGFGVFATVFDTDSSLLSSSESYFSTGEVSCKDEDRVVKAAAFGAKGCTGGSAGAPKRPTLKTEGSGTRKG
jgi:hypothetical protein